MSCVCLAHQWTQTSPALLSTAGSWTCSWGTLVPGEPLFLGMAAPPGPCRCSQGETCSQITFSLGGGDISGWGGAWDEEARQDIPAPPSPRPSGCVLMPPHSRLSQSSGFSLSAGRSPNSALYGCSSVKVRILIKYYPNAFSLYCLVLLPALVSLLIWSRMIQKFLDHQPFTWDSSGRSHRMSP